MSNEARTSAAERAAAAADEPTSIKVDVNGRKICIDTEGMVISGPKAMTGKFLAPSQLQTIRVTKEYHGHLLLSESKEETRLAEAELALMTSELGVSPDHIRENMMITYNGVGGRIEAVREAEGVADVTLGGVKRQLSIAKLVREAEFHPSSEKREEADEPLSEAELESLDEGARETAIEEETSVTVKEDRSLESYTDDELMSQAMERLSIIEKRKKG